jgi:uroporphyrinogen decarboxylase
MQQSSERISPSPHLLIRAIRGQAVERPPVWAMRQAGRWDPEFKRLRGTLPFYEFSENVELACKASLLPRRFGVDAIILFYDITTLPVAMGLPFRLEHGRGPVPDRPIQTLQDVQRLDEHLNPARYQHVRDLLRMVKAELKDNLPVIVFAGAPYTLGAYCIGAGKDLEATRRFAAAQPDTWNALQERLATATIGFLRRLADEGADVYQLFDSWAGLLSPEEYERWAQPYHKRIFAAARRIPGILFVRECPYLNRMVDSGADVVSLGSSHDLAAARRLYPYMVFQGNVDQELLRRGTPDQVAQATRRCVAAGGSLRHIVNLNHGVDPATPVENFQAYIDAVRVGIAS